MLREQSNETLESSGIPYKLSLFTSAAFALTLTLSFCFLPCFASDRFATQDLSLPLSLPLIFFSLQPVRVEFYWLKSWLRKKYFLSLSSQETHHQALLFLRSDFFENWILTDERPLHFLRHDIRIGRRYIIPFHSLFLCVSLVEILSKDDFGSLVTSSNPFGYQHVKFQHWISTTLIGPDWSKWYCSHCHEVKQCQSGGTGRTSASTWPAGDA